MHHARWIPNMKRTSAHPPPFSGSRLQVYNTTTITITTCDSPCPEPNLHDLPTLTSPPESSSPPALSHPPRAAPRRPEPPPRLPAPRWPSSRSSPPSAAGSTPFPGAHLSTRNCYLMRAGGVHLGRLLIFRL
ncbi:hypothetical protein E4U25_000631 [Claviceps purpurea]|nr:hypothetical protein E4U25_000631 [Claviceps purpurea]